MERNKKGQFIKGHKGYDSWSGKGFTGWHRDKIREGLKGNTNAQGHIASNKGQDSRIKVKCKNCEKLFQVYPYRKNTVEFCSKKCRAKFQYKEKLNRVPTRKGKEPWNKNLTRLDDDRIKKIAKDRTGNKNWMWKDNATSENKKQRYSVENRIWREKVFQKDNYTCQKCQKKGGLLRVHHKQNFSDYPELRFIVSNGITFCEECHKEFHNRYGRWHNTKEQVEEFLQKKD